MNAEEPCPVCSGSMRFCEHMDDPFAPAGDACRTCGCGTDGDGDCPCGCTDSEEVGTGAGEGATGQDTGTAWVTRSTDCPEAPAQAHPLGPDGFTRLDSTREAFALGAAWALGDDEEAPAALCAEVKRLSTERDRYRTAWKSAATRAGIAADQFEQLRGRIARAEALIDAWEHDGPDHTNPVFIGRLRECLRRDPAPVRLRGENHA